MRLILAASLLITPEVVSAQESPPDIFLPFIERAYPRVLISEVMSSNRSSARDKDGEAIDWIELTNLDPSPADITGWYLTDDPGELTKWRLPLQSLNPDEHLVVFASGKDRADEGAQLHTNFRLSSSGEYLALVAADGETIIHAYDPVPAQVADISYGLDDRGYPRYFAQPTPGQPNGTGGQDQGPPIAQIAHTPLSPDQSENLQVTAMVGGDPAMVSLRYRIMFDTERSIPMFDDGQHHDGAAGDGIFGAAIPASQYGAFELIRYAISAIDSSDNWSRLPIDADSTDAPEYFGTVANADDTGSQLPVLHWFVKGRNRAEERRGTRAALYFDGRFYDNVFVRLRGGPVAANWPKVNFKFDFNPGDHFYFSPDEEPVEEFNLNTTYSDKSYIRQVLSWETYRDAGSPYSISFPMRVQQNGKFYSVAIFVEQPDERYLSRQGFDPDGALYKMYTSLRSSDDVDKSDSAFKRTRLYEDKSDFNDFVRGINRADEVRDRWLYDNINIPQMVNYLAATTIIHDNDHVSKNYYLYRDSNGNREWSMLPWDKDLTFGRNYTGEFRYLVDTIWADEDPYSHPLFGDSDHRKIDGLYNLLIDVLYEDDRIREMYHRRLRTLMDQLLQPPGTPVEQLYYEQRIEELYLTMEADADLDFQRWRPTWGLSQRFRRALDVMIWFYLQPRRVHLYEEHGSPGNGEIPDTQPTSVQIEFGSFELDYDTIEQDREYLTLYNPNSFAVDISGWTLTGAVDHLFQPGVVIPANETLYLSPNVNAFRNRESGPSSNQALFVQGDYAGRISLRPGTVSLIDQNDETIANLTYQTPLSPLASQLTISELNYHPPDSGAIEGNEFEFIELLNVGDKTVDLSGFRFVDGIDFHFASDTTLAPNDLLVLIRNEEAFASRYNDVEHSGLYTQRLANSGERITLVDNQGLTVLSFVYDDGGLWPSAADGEGATLERTMDALPNSDPCVLAGKRQELWHPWSICGSAERRHLQNQDTSSNCSQAIESLHRMSNPMSRIAIFILATSLLCLTSCTVISATLVENQLNSRVERNAATANGQPEEAAVQLLNIDSRFSDENLEISAMAWADETLILVPQWPNWYGNSLFALPKAEILAQIDGKSTEPLQPYPISLNMDEIINSVERFGGFEAIGFDGTTVYMIIEIGGPGGALLLRGEISPDQSTIRMETETIAQIPTQAGLINMSDEALVIVNGWAMTIHEANGINVNPAPLVHYFGPDLNALGVDPLSSIEYRITDATLLDENSRFWVLNTYWPGDEIKLRPLLGDSEPLKAAFGVGASHAQFPTVERLVEFEIGPDGVKLVDRAPIQLKLLGSTLGTDTSRNWEGLVRLEDRGFLLVTDKFPRTMVGFVAYPAVE